MISSEQEFQKAYSIFLGKAWSSASNMAMAKAHPVAALNEAGFQLPADAKVNLSDIGGYSDMNVGYSMYQVGAKTGSYNIVLPQAPPSQGHIVNPESLKANDTTVCCCCCPCCSCT